mgnify:CR=1 FL=1
MPLYNRAATSVCICNFFSVDFQVNCFSLRDAILKREREREIERETRERREREKR